MQASARVVETFDVPTTGAAPAPEASRHRTTPARRIPRRAIEIAGLLIGISLVASVARSAELSNDEFWSLAAGQWMLAHHSFMGLDPFSYTESHRRWVTDEWGSEIALAGLFRLFGNAAYSLYAVILGGLCLLASAAYARALGARGGRVAAIVMVLAVGLAGIVASDRGLDFSLVWLPLEFLVLTKARHNPRWLLLLPPLCVLWVNTHGSILLGLLVLGVELGWSLIPARGARGRRSAPVPFHRLAGAGAAGGRGRVVHHAVRSGAPRLRLRRLAERPDCAVHHRVEFAQLPFVPDDSGLLHPAGPPRGLRLDAKDPAARGIAGPLPLRGGAADRATGDVPPRRGRRLGGDAAGAGAVGDHGAALDRGRTGGDGDRHPGHSRRPGRDGVADAADRRVQLPDAPARAGSSRSTRGATIRSPATGPPSSTGAPTSSRGPSSPSSWRSRT